MPKPFGFQNLSPIFPTIEKTASFYAPYMNRKHLVAIGVVIAVLLLLYWLFVAEDMNAWLNVN